MNMASLAVVLTLIVVAVAPWIVRGDSDGTPMLETLINKTAEPLLVERSSYYCQWERPIGPVCVYNATNQVVVVPEDLRLNSGQLELEIHNATVVKLYPTCVSWIQIYFTKMIYILPSKKNQYCRTWLRLYNSKVGRVEYGVKDLSLLDSEVDTIKLTNQRDLMAYNSTINEIEELEWDGYMSTMLNTSVNLLSKVMAHDNWSVTGSVFGTVASGGITFNAKKMTVINSTINHMSFKALTVESGTVSLTNVIINYLGLSAITVAKPHGFLSLSNVTIRSGDAPCIILLDRERLTLHNVTFNGYSLNESSPLIQYLDFPANETEAALRDQNKECMSNDTVLNCNFSRSTKDVAIVAEDIKNFKVVEVHDGDSLLISSTGCQADLRLKNVTVNLPHLTTLPATGDEKCNVTISAKNSSFHVIWAKNINNLNVMNSSIHRIHEGQLDTFMMENTIVREMDAIEVVGRGAVWRNCKFEDSIAITLKAPLNSFDITFRFLFSGGQANMEENSIVIDHPGKTTTFNRWTLAWMKRRSVVVKSGSRLELNNIEVRRLDTEAIYLEEGATVFVKDFHITHTDIYIFSVASKDQVEVDGTISNFKRDFLVHVRSTPREVDQHSNFTVSDSHLSAYCRTVFYLHICNFSSVPKEVIVDFAASRLSSRVIIEEAEMVTLLPSCVEKVILMNVKKASTRENGRECGTWLEATGVHIINVTSGVHDVTLKSCTVDLLAPDRRLRDVDLEDTTVERLVGVQWSGYTGVFNSSRLGEVHRLLADSRLMMSNTKVGILMADGMFLAAEAFIINTTFKEIRTSGMKVNGATRMQNVTIERLERGGIEVLDGRLLLINVRILYSDDKSITAGVNGGICFQNVTVAGKKVHWKGYLTHPDSSEESVVFLNKHFNESLEVSQSGPITSTDTSTTTKAQEQSSPQASSMAHSRMTNMESETSSVVPNVLVSSASSSSWKWAGAGIGFCAGLLVGVFIFLAIKVVKPNRAMLLTRPTVFWRVSDDHHELLEEDQAVEESSAPRQDQGYTTVPPSDM